MSLIPLADDPTRGPYEGPRLLERAIAVVRFPPIMKLTADDLVISKLQDAIRHEYPFFERKIEGGVQMELQPDGQVKTNNFQETSLRFQNADKTRVVTIANSLLALDVQTDGYDNWQTFVTWMRELLKSLADVAAPSHVELLGVRYLNAAAVGGDSDPREICARELVSVSGVPGIQVADLLWQFDVPEGILILRNGLMPSMRTYDPSFFVPRERKTWYLDIDVARLELEKFDSDQISERLLAQAKRLYAIYYWAMKREEAEEC